MILLKRSEDGLCRSAGRPLVGTGETLREVYAVEVSIVRRVVGLTLYARALLLKRHLRGRLMFVSGFRNAARREISYCRGCCGCCNPPPCKPPPRVTAPLSRRPSFWSSGGQCRSLRGIEALDAKSGGDRRSQPSACGEPPS